MAKLAAPGSAINQRIIYLTTVVHCLTVPGTRMEAVPSFLIKLQMANNSKVGDR